MYIREHLREPHLWTPEQIAGRLPIDHPGASITPETIYRYIYSKKGERYKLFKYLPYGKKKRMKQNGRSVQIVNRDGHVPGSISIDLRPEVVSLRSRIGDWESDLMEGKKSDDSIVSTTVENTIDRVRHFIPKGVSIDQIPEDKIKQIETILNNTPRKCLGYLTPNEKMLHYLQSSTS